MEPTLTDIVSPPHTDSNAATVTSAPNLEALSLARRIQDVLDEHSAQDVISVDVRGKSSVADVMLIASGRSNRHVAALADYVRRDLKEAGETAAVEGAETADWVLIDAGDVILHIFRPEVRAFYNIEKIWSLPLPDSLRNLADPQLEDD